MIVIKYGGHAMDLAITETRNWLLEIKNYMPLESDL